jgi:hypothetical protein
LDWVGHRAHLDVVQKTVDAVLTCNQTSVIQPPFSYEQLKAIALKCIKTRVWQTVTFNQLKVIMATYYRCAPISAGNTFQDLLQLCETADDTEQSIECDIHVPNINMVKFN